MILIDNIKKIRKLKNLTQKEFSDLLGIKNTTLSNIEVGITKPDIEIIQAISLIYGISIDDLVSKEIETINNISKIPKYYEKVKKSNINGDNNHKISRIPLITVDAMAGYANGDVQVMEHELIDNYVIPEFAQKGVKYLIRVGGSSMYPKYSNGDLLACRPIKDLSFFQWGKVYVLDTDQGPLVKRIFPLNDNIEMIECRSDNFENYPPFQLYKTSIRKISIVVGVIRIE